MDETQQPSDVKSPGKYAAIPLIATVAIFALCMVLGLGLIFSLLIALVVLLISSVVLLVSASSDTALTLKRTALVTIPGGALLAIIGIFGYLAGSLLSVLLWIGLLGVVIGIVCAIGAAWGTAGPRR